MKGTMKLVAVTVLLMAMVMPLQAKTDLSFGGQIRNQSFAAKTSFDTAAEYQSYDLLRTRFNIKARVDDNVTVFIQAQDSRTYGLGGYSGTTKAGSNVDLHQGYFAIDNIFGEGWGVMAGRFEFTKGNHRVFGNVGWSNVGRSWDGGTMWYTQEKFTITGFGLKIAERDPIGGTTYLSNQDYTVYGLYGELNKLNLDLFVLFEEDARKVLKVAPVATMTDTTVEKAMERLTLGLYYHRTHNKFDYEMNFALQGGKYIAWNQDNSSSNYLHGFEIDYGGMMFAAEAGYSFMDSRNTRVAAGVDYTSGDKTNDTKDKVYRNLFWTGHKFNGYMDYFVNGGPNGLMDFLLRGKTDITNGWTFLADLHLFSSAQDYVADDPATAAIETSKDIGMEIDLTVKTTRVKGILLQGGVSYFSAKDDYAGMTDSDPGVWSYTMATVNF
ncbi:MAG: alginate export family protein [bacterium]|nr:alginate export family protein [bacterium]